MFCRDARTAGTAVLGRCVFSFSAGLLPFRFAEHVFLIAKNCSFPYYNALFEAQSQGTFDRIHNLFAFYRSPEAGSCPVTPRGVFHRRTLVSWRRSLCIPLRSAIQLSRFRRRKILSDPLRHVFTLKNDNHYFDHKKFANREPLKNKNQDTAIQRQIMESICQPKMPYPDLFNGCCFPALSDKNILRYGGFRGDFRVLWLDHTTSS